MICSGLLVLATLVFFGVWWNGWYKPPVMALMESLPDTNGDSVRMTFSGLVSGFPIDRCQVNWSGNVVPSEDLCTSEMNTNWWGGCESENPKLRGQWGWVLISELNDNLDKGSQGREILQPKIFNKASKVTYSTVLWPLISQISSGMWWFWTSKLVQVKWTFYFNDTKWRSLNSCK